MTALFTVLDERQSRVERVLEFFHRIVFLPGKCDFARFQTSPALCEQVATAVDWLGNSCRNIARQVMSSRQQIIGRGDFFVPRSLD